MATLVVGTEDFGIELCKALNLDPKKVKNIILICKADDAVMIQTTSYVTQDEANEVIKVIGKYNLTEKENENNQTKL